MRTLILDQGYQPHRIVRWERAVVMLFDGKVEVVSAYDQHEIHSVSLTMKTPAVVRLVRSIRWRERRVRFSKANVAARDGHRCQYCDRRPTLKELTFDHVIPKSKGGRTTWENVVMACRRCNLRKANRTPQQAGMHLRTRPVRPAWRPSMLVRGEIGVTVPEPWAFWLGLHAEQEEGEPEEPQARPEVAS